MISGTAQERAAKIEALRKRVDENLVPKFNGAIKYLPMLMDHPDWSDDECIAFARKWHAVAKELHDAGDPRWNEGIPYCRNVYK